MANLTFSLVQDLAAAEKLWRQFSPNQTPYDDWAYRSSFYLPTKFPLHFYLGQLENQPIGLLALQFNPQKNALEFFGGSFMEYNHVLILPEHQFLAIEFYRHLIGEAQENIILRDLIDGDDSLPGYEPYDQTFTLDLSQFKTTDEFFQQKFSSKSRNSFRRKFRQLEKKIEIIENNFEDLDLLIEYNKTRFGQESSFQDPAQIETFHLFPKLELDFILQTFVVNGSKEAVSLSLAYHDIFLYIMAGTNLSRYPNLGSYLVLKAIEKGLAKDKNTFDAGRNPSGWKDRWHLDPHPVYRLVRNQ